MCVRVSLGKIQKLLPVQCHLCVSIGAVSRPEKLLVSDGINADCVQCSGLEELYINLFLLPFNPNTNIINWEQTNDTSTLKC